MSVMDLMKGGFSLSSPASSDAANYGSVFSQGTTGAFNFGSGAGTATAQGQGIPMETLAILGLFAWLIISQR